MKIALIGNGAIAKLVAQFCAARPDKYTVTAALGLPSDVTSVGAYPVVQTLAELLATKPDLVVECAGHSAVKAYGAAILNAGVNLVVVSTGSLADQGLWDEISQAAEHSRAMTICCTTFSCPYRCWLGLVRPVARISLIFSPSPSQ